MQIGYIVRFRPYKNGTVWPTLPSIPSAEIPIVRHLPALAFIVDTGAHNET